MSAPRDTSDEAEGATFTSTTAVSVGTETAAAVPPPPEDGEPIGPSAADEAEMRDAGIFLERVAPPGAKADDAGKLPTLQSLVAKLPPAVKEALNEHLRGSFVRVKKLKPGELR